MKLDENKILISAAWFLRFAGLCIASVVASASLIIFVVSWMSTKTVGDQNRDEKISALEQIAKDQTKAITDIGLDIKGIQKDIESIKERGK